MARMYQCLPVAPHGNSVQMAFVEPLNPAAADELRVLPSRRTCRVVVADPALIQKAIEKFYTDDGESFSELLKDLGSDQEMAREASAATDDAAALADMADAAPIVRFVNWCCSRPSRRGRATFTSSRSSTNSKSVTAWTGRFTKCRRRRKHLATAIASRIKVMANLNIAERRVPQDGRIRPPWRTGQVDLRVSTLPTQFGEAWCCACWTAPR